MKAVDLEVQQLQRLQIPDFSIAREGKGLRQYSSKT